MKFKHIALGIVAGALLSGCTDLDETLYSQLNDSNLDFTDINDISLLEGEAVAKYRFIHVDWSGKFFLEENCSDQWCTPGRTNGWGAHYILEHKHAYGTNDPWVENVWNLTYNCIIYCCKVLDALPEDAVQARAQMRFFRAMCYYHLLDLYRNVPLMTTMNVAADYVPPQADSKTIFDFCVSEFSDIKETIGVTKNKGWGNKDAVCMALAKLYLNRGVYLSLDDNTEGYTNALSYVQEIIDDGRYSLCDNYSDNFKINANLQEAIFVVPEDGTHAAHFPLTGYSLIDAGLAAFNSTAAAYNGSAAIPQFMKTYDVDWNAIDNYNDTVSVIRDTRFSDCWAHDSQFNYNKSTAKANDPSQGHITYESGKWNNLQTSTNWLMYSCNLHNIEMTTMQEGYRLIKYEIEPGTAKGCSGDDFSIFRYADALLIKAECLLRLGRDESVAVDLVNQVRQRAYKNGAAPDNYKVTLETLKGNSKYKYGTQNWGLNVESYDWSNYTYNEDTNGEIVLGGLFDELGWEFCTEFGHRRQDMIRFKLTNGKSVFTGKSYFCKEAATDNHAEIYSIPEAIMQTNKNLKQNPGYDASQNVTFSE